MKKDPFTRRPTPRKHDANPFVERHFEFPGRLFVFDDAQGDSAHVRAITKNFERTYCELGSGSGNHLIELARQHPNACCVGFELRFKRSVRTIEKAFDHNIENAFVCRIPAEACVEVFEPNSVDGMYVNFPDPWGKRRDQKKRLLQASFLSDIRRILRKKGFLSLKTDHEVYFDWFLGTVQELEGFVVESSTRDLHASEYAQDNIVTEFEHLFLSQQLPIYHAVIRVHENVSDEV